MADTTAADMIVPEVWEDMVQAEFVGRTVMAGLSTTDTTLEGRPGNTVHFPKFLPLSDAAELTEGTAMTTETLQTDDDTATIKEAGKAVELTDNALLEGFGNPLQEAQRQVGITVARKIDADLITTASASGALTHAPGTSIGWPVIADGMGQFGDEAVNTDSVAGLVIHSKQKTTIWKDADFLSADKMGQGNQIIRTGQIGEIAGIPVFVSDRVPARDTSGDGANDEFDALILLNGSMGLLYKRRPVAERDRDVLKRSTVVTTNVHYGTKRLDDNGVLVLTTSE